MPFDNKTLKLIRKSARTAKIYIDLISKLNLNLDNLDNWYKQIYESKQKLDKANSELDKVVIEDDELSDELDTYRSSSQQQVVHARQRLMDFKKEAKNMEKAMVNMKAEAKEAKAEEEAEEEAEAKAKAEALEAEAMKKAEEEKAEAEKAEKMEAEKKKAEAEKAEKAEAKKKAEAEKKKALEAMKKALEKKKKALEKARAEAKEAKAEKKVAEEALEKALEEEAKEKVKAKEAKAEEEAEAMKKALEKAKEAEALEEEAKEAKAKAEAEADPDDSYDSDDPEGILSVVHHVSKNTMTNKQLQDKEDQQYIAPKEAHNPEKERNELLEVVKNEDSSDTSEEDDEDDDEDGEEDGEEDDDGDEKKKELNLGSDPIALTAEEQEEQEKKKEVNLDNFDDYNVPALTAEDQEEQKNYDDEDAPDEERVDGEKDGQIIGNERRDHWLFSQNLQEAQNLKQAEEVRKRALEALQAREEAMRQAPKEDKKPRKRRPRKNKFLVEKAEFLKENYGVRNTGVVHGLSSSDSDSDSDNDSVKPFIGKLKLRDMSDKLNKSAQTLREKVYKYEQESGSEQELKNIMELLRKIERRSMKLFKEIKRQGRQIPNMDKNKEVIQTIFAIQSSDALFRRGSQLMRQSEGKIPMKGKIIGTNKIIQQEARNIFVQWHKLLGRFYRSLNLKTATASELYVNEFGRQWYQTISGELAKKKNIKKKKNKKTFAQKISPEPEKKRPRSNDKVTRNLLKRPDTQSSDEKLIRKMKNESEEPRKEIALDTVRRNLVKELNKEDEEQDEEEEEEEPNASTSINFRF